MRRWLIVIHRYLGIVLSSLVVLWFASGIVMIYAGDMPNLAPPLRLARAVDLDPSRVTLGPADAARRANLSGPPEAATLLSVLDRPAYRFLNGQTVTIVFADTGERLTRLSLAECRRLASRFAGVSSGQVEYVAMLTRPDQWTLVDRRMPVYKFRIHDEAATELYVAPELGDVTVMTTRRARLLAWLGAIPHWLYWPSLRLNRPLWYHLIVWTSALGCVMTVLGLIVGVLHLRRGNPSGRARWIPYAGAMWWHHVTGLVFGFFALTWLFSGLLSMEPFAWTRASAIAIRNDDLAGGPLDLTKFSRIPEALRTERLGAGRMLAVDFVQVLGEPYYLVTAVPEQGAASPVASAYRPDGALQVQRWLVDGASLDRRREPFSMASLVGRVAMAAPGVPIVEVRWLAEYDRYYYPRYGRVPPLPVVRVKLADPAASWVYLDPSLGQVVAVVSRRQRLERWLYHGLHSLDVVFPYASAERRAAVILLSLGGLLTSSLGGYLGWKRVVRAVRRRRR